MIKKRNEYNTYIGIPAKTFYGAFMTFVEAFYSFNFDITNVDTGISDKVRVKTPRHPYESLEHLFARVLAFAHCWTKKTEFSHGMFEPNEPAIWKKDELGNISCWTDIGCPSKKKILTALRAALHPPLSTQYSVYFYNPEQIGSFCAELRGSKTNWISDISFYRISQDILDSLIPLEKSSSRLNVTIVDNVLYLICDGVELETIIEPLDMWSEFQSSISNI